MLFRSLLDRYEKDHALFPQRVICGTESFPLQALENWQAVKHFSHVIGDFVWVAWDYIGESGLGRSEFDTKQNPAGTRIGLVGSVEIWHAEIAASAARRRTQRQAVGPTTRKGGHAFYIDFPYRSRDCYAEFSGKKQ